MSNDSKEVLNEVHTYLDYLQQPNEAFLGMPACPFLKSELKDEKLMTEVWRPQQESFMELYGRFVESEYESALIVCMNTDGILWEQVDRKSYQRTIQKLLKETEHKALCFSPFEEHTAGGGEETRKKSPYFLINIAKKEVLKEAHRSLLKTRYFDNFTDEELDTLKVYPKKK